MKYVTFTTKGSCRLCENFLLSTRKVGIEPNVVVYCLDTESYDTIKNKYQCETKLFEVPVGDNFHEYGRHEFRRVTEAKIQIILRELEGNESLVYTDCDVVFLKDPTEFILGVDDTIKKDNNRDIDIYFASDSPFMDICTGFMYIKNRHSIHELFKLFFNMSYQYGRIGSECMYDQEIINQILKQNELKEELKVAIYPTNFVMNGHLYWNEPKKRTGNETVVHVNFTIGEENKINRLREANLWYIQEEVIT
jgi:rhamnogalacturonan II specific xylosyltransferase